MRVLLIQPPLEDFYTTAIRLYPLGLLYAASVLRQGGIDVQLLDCLTPLKKERLPLPPDFDYLKPFLNGTPHFFRRYYRFGLPATAIVNAIKAFSPDRIGISSQFTAYYKSVAELVALIKSNFAIPVFIGGNHATVFSKEIEQRTPQIDAVLAGPAEIALPAHISTWPGKSEIKKTPVDWKKVLPAHDLLSAGAYRIGRKNYMSITASRGCPFGCDFCSVRAMFGRSMEYRQVEAIISEMKWNYLNKNVRIFNFEDDNLSADKSWFESLLKAVIADPLLKEVELTAMNGICYPTLDESVLELMRRAGFYRLNLSYVTRSVFIRQRYHRPSDGDMFESVIRSAQKFGFLITVYVIIGLPEQTYAEMKDSIDYLLELGVLVGPSPFYLPPGSALYDDLKLPENIRTNWNLYRSSAFSAVSDHADREQLIGIFSYTRRKNLESRSGGHSLANNPTGSPE